LLLAVGLGLAVVVVWYVGARVVLDLLIRIRWRVLLVSGIYAMHVGIRAAALWRVMLTSALSYPDILRIRLSAEAVERLTFTGPFLAEPTKGWLLTRRGTPTSAAFAAVITEYLLYTLVSSCLAMAALLVLVERQALPIEFRPAAVIILIVAAVFVVAFTFASLTGIGLIVPALRSAHVVMGQRALRLSERFSRIEAVIIEFLHEHPHRLFEVLAIETAAQALLVTEVWFVIAVLGYSPSWTQSLIIEGGVKFVAIVFAFVPGQVGAAEGTYALIAKAIGLPAAVGLTIAVARRIRSPLVAVVGLIALALIRDRYPVGTA
jgi:hypothetical protein